MRRLIAAVILPAAQPLAAKNLPSGWKRDPLLQHGRGPIPFHPFALLVPMNANITAVVVLLLVSTPAWAINKCTKDGKTVYQEMPCDHTAQSEPVRVFAGQGEPATRSLPSRVSPQAESPSPQAKPDSKPQGGAVSLGPQNDAATNDDLVAQCLNWYRPRLKNPAGAYADNASRSGSVLSITVYGTNSFGGYVGKRAACEVKNGAIDHDWTRIHAQRAGWN